MWTIEYKSGVFEGQDLVSMATDIGNHYAELYFYEEMSSLPQIQRIYWTSASGIECNVSDGTLSFMDDQCEIARLAANAEYAINQHNRDAMRSDYYGGAL